MTASFRRSAAHVLLLLLAGVLPCVGGCSSERDVRFQPPTRHPTPPAKATTSAGCSDEERTRSARQVLRGLASYYAQSLAGNPTASGAPYDPKLASAAHRTLPFGTRLRVTRTDASVEPVCVTVNDRGPFAGRKRIVDLSRRAAEALQMLGEGVVPVRVDVL